MPFLLPRAAQPKPSGFGCCGKRAIETKEDQDLLSSPCPSATRTSQGASTPPPGSSSAIDRLWGSVRLDGQYSPEEAEWKVGGRYKVLRSVPVFGDADMGGNRVGDLRVKDLVLLLETRSLGAMEAGLVMPSPPDEPGWILLEEASANCPLERKRQLEGSWEMRARYMVKSPATMRAEADMSSAELDEVKPGEEVLVLELGVGRAAGLPSSRGLRLRMMIRTDAGKIGWISPETSTGERLLYPVNLLGPQVVDLHRMTMTGGAGVPPRSSMRAAQGTGQALPWQAGCKYRVLERVALRESVDLVSLELGAISPGCIVAVTDVQTSWCPDLGMCPSAKVVVDSGPEEGATGWVRCSHKDGHDIIDSRDQLEVDKVVQELRRSQMALPPQDVKSGVEADGFYTDGQLQEGCEEGAGSDGSDSTSGTRDEDEQEDGRPDASKQMRFPETPGAARGQSRETEAETPGLVPQQKASRIFEEANEDKPIGEPTVVEDRAYNCCSCTVRRR